jgi:hypothetical protein
VALVACALLGLTSCTRDPSPEPEPELTAPPPRVADVSELRLPLDAYMYTNDQYLAMLRARAHLISACMRRFGRDYPATVTNAVPGVHFPDLDNANARRYGLFDAESAALYGYNVPPRPEAAEPDSRSTGSGGLEITERDLFLLDGRGRPGYENATLPTDVDGNALPEDGCNGEADRALADGLAQPDLGVVDTLAFEAHQRAEQDSRVRAAVEAWSACMKARGYAYSSIWEPNDYPWPEPPGPEEIATATADVACKEETNLVGIAFAVESAYQVRLIERHSAELNAVKAYIDAVNRNAARFAAN